MTLTVNTSRTKASTKRVYRNSDGVPITITVTADTLKIYAPGCVMTHAEFGDILSTLQADWDALRPKSQHVIVSIKAGAA